MIVVGCVSCPSNARVPLPASSSITTDSFPAGKTASPLLASSRQPSFNGCIGFPGSSGLAPNKTTEPCSTLILAISFDQSCMLVPLLFVPVTSTSAVPVTLVPTSGPHTVVFPVVIRSKLSITKFTFSTVLVLDELASPLPVA